MHHINIASCGKKAIGFREKKRFAPESFFAGQADRTNRRVSMSGIPPMQNLEGNGKREENVKIPGQNGTSMFGYLRKPLETFENSRKTSQISVK